MGGTQATVPGIRRCLAAAAAAALAAGSATADELRPYGWQTPGGGYLDPTSFFAVHGYVDAVFAGTSADWTAADPAQIGPPGQVLVPASDRMSFGADAAVFLSSEISPRTRAMLELHLVGDPSGVGAAGPGGLTLVLTEATASWDMVERYLSLSGGVFWAPFGDVNRDWLSAQNLFTLLPRASGAFPGHFNERGVRLDGWAELSTNVGINYVVSLGNGVQAFDIRGQTPVDLNQNKTVVGRVGLFPGLGERLELAASAAWGELRDAADPGLAVDEPQRYAANFVAYGADATLRVGDVGARAYVIGSQENLAGTVAELARLGAMGELSYAWVFADAPLDLHGLRPRARLDWLRQERLETSPSVGAAAVAAAAVVASLGADLMVHRSVSLGVEYHLQREIDSPDLDNDRLMTRFVAQF